MAREELLEQETERVHVTRRADGVAAGLLRTHVARRADDHVLSPCQKDRPHPGGVPGAFRGVRLRVVPDLVRLRCVGVETREAEVEHLDIAR